MDKTASPPIYQTGHAMSADGTQIGYRQLGNGPSLILVHGGMQASQNFMKLGEYLADSFTVYIVDRRGRGMSGPFGNNYSLVKDCEDVKAIADKTNTNNIFGLSSGGVISLQTTLLFPDSILKIAIYEPPFLLRDIIKGNFFIERFDREIFREEIADAFITVTKGLQISPLFKFLPRFLLTPLFRLMFKKEEVITDENDVPIKSLVPTFHFDYKIVTETVGTLENYKVTNAEVLLLGGSKSPDYLLNGLKKLASILPNAKKVIFKGLDHMGPDNSGKPELIAQELKKFFS
ncbi:MAG TPA: alpha/beta hydrolase [Mucilaginibacter sp.]|jgi:pimeloyl-ACP methyl ester carboxylesterase